MRASTWEQQPSSSRKLVLASRRDSSASVKSSLSITAILLARRKKSLGQFNRRLIRYPYFHISPGGAKLLGGVETWRTRESFSSHIADASYWWFTVIPEVLLPEQAPAGRKSRAKCGAYENLVIQIPDRCLTRASIVKEIVRLPVAIKVGSSYHRPATGQSQPKSASDEG